jgi:hypothetical protein
MHPSDNSSYQVVWLKSLADVDRNQWDALAEPLATPFMEWDWLYQMEISKSTVAETGTALFMAR